MAPFHFAHLLYSPTHSLARLVQDLDELESEAYEQKLRTIERNRTQPSLLKPGAVPGLGPGPNPNPNLNQRPKPEP